MYSCLDGSQESKFVFSMKLQPKTCILIVPIGFRSVMEKNLNLSSMKLPKPETHFLGTWSDTIVNATFSICMFFSYFLLQADFDYWDPFKSEYWNAVSYIYLSLSLYLFWFYSFVDIVLVRVMKLQLYLLLLLLFVKHSAD